MRKPVSFGIQAVLGRSAGIALASALAAMPHVSSAADLYSSEVIGIFSDGIFVEPPGSPTEVLGGSSANYARCKMAISAGMKALTTANTADIDNVVFGAGMFCTTASNGVINITGRTGVTRTISSVSLCLYDPVTRGCGMVVASAGPASATSGTTTLWATGEVETDFLTVNTLYVVKATMSVSHPAATWYAAPETAPASSSLPCVGTSVSTYTCTVTSVPFRYYP